MDLNVIDMQYTNSLEEFLSHSMFQVRNGNFLKMHVSEIRVKRILVNQGLGVLNNVKRKKNERKM